MDDNLKERTAFPQQGPLGPNGKWTATKGLSIREYFAGQMLAAIISKTGVELNAQEKVTTAIEYADALIGELERTREETKTV